MGCKNEDGGNLEYEVYILGNQETFTEEWVNGLEKVLKRFSDKLNDLDEIKTRSNERLKKAWIPSKAQIGYIASVGIGGTIGNLIKNASLPEYLGTLAAYCITGYNICVMYNLFKSRKGFKEDLEAYERKWDSNLEEEVGD